MTQEPTLALHATSRPAQAAVFPLTLLDQADPLLWYRDGRGMIGLGRTLTLEFRGADRIREAATYWRQIVAAATVTDSVQQPGSGLIAFGKFTFSGSSEAVSTLIVPEQIYGFTPETSWVTTITVGTGSATDPAEAAHLPELGGTPLGEKPIVTFHPGRMDRQRYRSAVSSTLSLIEQGSVEKVVLARDIIGELKQGDIRTTLSSLTERYPDCWTFSVDGLLGSSPETLVRVRSGTFEARVLAGSAARGDIPIDDTVAANTLTTSPKELAEHEFAVRSVLDTLADHSTATTATGPFLLELPNLWHLASDIGAELATGTSALDAAMLVHPTAAVAGAPTTTALQVIDELENFDRTFYAGPVGWVDAEGDGEWAIALRCAQLTGNLITAMAGCGVVSGSTPDSELAETELKLRPITEAFG